MTNFPKFIPHKASKKDNIDQFLLQVQMRIVVADNGYSHFLQGSQEDPKMVIQDVTIQVEAVNDMPYLSWLHLPPKAGSWDAGGLPMRSPICGSPCCCNI